MAITRAAKHAKPPMSNSLYDALKFIAQVFLPALGTLYYALSQIWGLPYAEEVVGTIVAVDFFLGTILKLTTNAYNNSPAKYDGALVVDTTRDDKDIYTFEVDDVVGLKDKNEIMLKVKGASS